MPHTHSPLETRRSPQIPVGNLCQAGPEQHDSSGVAEGASGQLPCGKIQGHQDTAAHPWHPGMPKQHAQKFGADVPSQGLPWQKQQHEQQQRKVHGKQHDAMSEAQLPQQLLQQKEGAQRKPKQQQLQEQGHQPEHQLVQESRVVEQRDSVPSSWRLWSQKGHAPADRECRTSAVLSCPSNIPTPCQPPVGPRYPHSSSPSAHDSLTPPPPDLHPFNGQRSGEDHRRGRIGSSVYGIRMSHGCRDGSSTEADNPSWRNPTHASSSPDDGCLTAPTDWTSPSGEASPILEAPSWPGRNAHRLRVKALEGGPSGHQMGCGDENGGHIPPTRRSIRHPIALLAPKPAWVQRGAPHHLPPAQLDVPSEDSCTSQTTTHCDAADFPRPAGNRRNSQKWYSEPSMQRPAAVAKHGHPHMDTDAQRAHGRDPAASRGCGNSKGYAAGCPTCHQGVPVGGTRQAGSSNAQRRGVVGAGRRPWQRQARAGRMAAGNRRRPARYKRLFLEISWITFNYNVCSTCPSFCPSFDRSQYSPQYSRQTRPGACAANIAMPSTPAC